tara:strand:- start:326 stop:1099 length:774 start_codon:yes stop_codon:yes gene_type:complete
MAKSPKKDFHDQENVAGSDMGGAINAFSNLTSGNPIAMANTFVSAFGPVLADVPSMINPSGASKAAAEKRRQQLLAENEERRLRKERERQEELEAKRKKKEEEDAKKLARRVSEDKATKERTLEKDTKRIAAGLVTQQEALESLKTGEPPKPRSYSRFEEAELNSAFTRRRRRRRRSAMKKATRKVCLPAKKVASMSEEEKNKVINAKQTAANKGEGKRSSSSNVKSARKPGATLRDWFKNENWVQVGNPSKKCGEA